MINEYNALLSSNWVRTSTNHKLVGGLFQADEWMRKFLFRLPIALNSLGLVETWLMKDRLMNYRVEGKEYTLTLEDVIMHFGLEVIDSYDNMTIRKEYLNSVGEAIFLSMLVGSLADFSVIEPEQTEDGSKIISGNWTIVNTSC